MTMSVTIHNTSNWDNENVIIDTELQEIVLKPGDHHTTAMPERIKSIRFAPMEPGKKAEPFIMNGHQMIPETSMGWRKT